TRSYGDWSSDVCSSDLRLAAPPRLRRLDKQIRDAGARLARAEKEQALRGERPARLAQRGEQAGERDGGRALDVVVKARHALAIRSEERRVGKGGRSRRA